MRANLPVHKTTLSSRQNPPAPVTTVAERFQMVWDLTREAWELMGKPLDESRLPRHVVRVERGRR